MGDSIKCNALFYLISIPMDYKPINQKISAMTKFDYKFSCSQWLQVGLHVFYVINMYVKFRANWMLFTIRFTNLFFIYNFLLQKFGI